MCSFGWSTRGFSILTDSKQELETKKEVGSPVSDSFVVLNVSRGYPSFCRQIGECILRHNRLHGVSTFSIVIMSYYHSDKNIQLHVSHHKTQSMNVCIYIYLITVSPDRQTTQLSHQSQKSIVLKYLFRSLYDCIYHTRAYKFCFF